MGWSKLDLITKAFGVCGLASEDLSAEALQDGLSSLDALMAVWDAAGVRLGYPLSATPTSGDVSEDSGIPDWANRAVFMNLGIELAAGIGREVSPRIAMMAKQAYNRLLARVADPPRMRFPDTLPAGAGNKPWRGGNGGSSRFIQDEDDGIDAGPDSELEFK